MKAMIFAAGLGTRLKPITDTMPKALVPIGGKPLLQIVLEKLQRSGFRDVVINVHHFADMIEEWCQAHPMGVHIQFSDERKMLLETGGGIKYARNLLTDCESFLIHNVDILSNVDLQEFFGFGKKYEACLLVSPRETQRYLLFDDSLRLVGWTNMKTGEIKSPYSNLQVEKCHKYAFSGIHEMSTSLFPLFDTWPDKFSIIDFYLSMCAEHEVRGYLKEDLRLVDVGKVETLASLETNLEF